MTDVDFCISDDVAFAFDLVENLEWRLFRAAASTADLRWIDESSFLLSQKKGDLDQAAEKLRKFKER